MKPISYTGTENNVTFHYKYSDLKEFITLGKRDGNVGWLLVSYKEGMLKYRCFGTIEHPCNTMLTFTMMYNPTFDGEFSIEKIMNPKPFWSGGTWEYDIWDFGGKDGNSNIQTIKVK